MEILPTLKVCAAIQRAVGHCHFILEIGLKLGVQCFLCHKFNIVTMEYAEKELTALPSYLYV